MLVRRLLPRGGLLALRCSALPVVRPYALRVDFINKDDSVTSCAAEVGQNLLDVAHKHQIDLEGACDGACACRLRAGTLRTGGGCFSRGSSTCHVILEPDVFDSLPPATDEEEDMLDLAKNYTMTSRLGCQVVLEAKHDGIKVKVRTGVLVVPCHAHSAIAGLAASAVYT